MFIAGVKVQKVLQIKAICHKSDILTFIFFYARSGVMNLIKIERRTKYEL